MELKEEANDDIINYPKSNNKSNHIFYPHKNHSYDLLKNPNINHFTSDSFFIFDQPDCIKYFNSLGNKNNIKLNLNEFEFLKSLGNSILIEKYINDNTLFISLDKNIYDQIHAYFKVEKPLSDLATYLQRKITSSNTREKLSYRNLLKNFLWLQVKKSVKQL